MGERILITETMKNAVGKEQIYFTIKVDIETIKKLTDAVEDPNPLWQDEGYARKTRYGGVISPPYFLGMSNLHEHIETILMDGPCRRILNGGTKMEFLSPIKVGDIITRKDKLVNLFTKKSRTYGEIIIDL